MRVDLKPLTYYMIHENATVRFKSRTAEEVSGIMTTSDGQEVAFSYDPDTFQIHLPDRIVRINYGGWVESEKSVTDSEHRNADDE